MRSTPLVVAEGYLTDWARERLLSNFTHEEGGFVWGMVGCKVLALSSELEDEDGSDADDDSVDPDLYKQIMLDLIDREIERLTAQRSILEDKERADLETTRQSYHLPSKDEADRILRYETTIERQLYRAIDQLERLQRARQGETVPPPLKVQVSSQN